MKKLFAVILAVLLSAGILGGCAVHNDTGKVTEVDVKLDSTYGIVMDISHNRVLLKKNADKKARPASLTKVLTAIVVLENTKDMNEKAKMYLSDYRYLHSIDTYTVGFRPGEMITMKSCLYGALFLSASDACYIMAHHVAGSEKAFVVMMNEKAKELGMRHSHFADSVGEDNDGTYTTAEDYAKLLSYALKNRTFQKIFEGKTYTIKADNMMTNDMKIDHQVFEHVSSDSLIKGGKLGFTDKAQTCLASCADIKGTRYICITMHAQRTIGSIYPNIQDAEMVYDDIKAQYEK